MEYTNDGLQTILDLHKKWLYNLEGGVRADLRHTNLRHTNLSGADLRGADLSHADLSGTNLRGTNLRGTNLRGTNFDDDRWNECAPGIHFL